MDDTWLLVGTGIVSFIIGAAAYQLSQRRSADPGAPALPPPAPSSARPSARPPAKPALERYSIGEVRINSGPLLLADLRRTINALAVDNLAPGTWPVIADVLVNPQGARQIARITLKRGDADPATRALLGEVAVDSGHLVIIEQATYQQMWIHEGPNRTSDSLAAALRDKPSCEQALAGGANVVAVVAGGGPGLYPVFGSYSAGRLNMLEIPLIDPESNSVGS
jgi:hypothetical protein